MNGSIYLSQNWSVNSLSDLQFSAIDINALSPTFVPKEFNQPNKSGFWTSNPHVTIS